MRVAYAGFAQKSLDGAEVWNTKNAPSRKRKAVQLDEPQPPKVLRPAFFSDFS